MTPTGAGVLARPPGGLCSSVETMSDERRIPRLAADVRVSGSALTPAEGFLLSRIDGRTSWSQLRLIGGIPEDEVDRCLERWLREGLVTVNGSSKTAGGAGEEGIDLTPEEQRRILEFERGLDRPYHELLGVERNSDAKDVKRAYFLLSKAFHPDRFFRRELGTFRPRIERIFRKIVEAYELLSDPTTRAEIERALAHAPPPADTAARAADRAAPADVVPAMSSRRAVLERLRRQFRMPEKIMTERRFKARQFFQAAMIAAKKERWLEAGASIRLAIAFDPWEGSYKQSFAEIQGQVHRVRADELLRDAEASLDAQSLQSAMRMYEEALAYRPCDLAINQRAADLAFELGELTAAREYAQTACEADPENGESHRRLGKILAGAGLVDKAKAALERALEIDPEDAAASAQLAALKRNRDRKR